MLAIGAHALSGRPGSRVTDRACSEVLASLLNLEKARETRKQKHNAKMAKVEARLPLMVEGAGTLRDRMANPRRGLIKNKDIQD